MIERSGREEKGTRLLLFNCCIDNRFQEYSVCRELSSPRFCNSAKLAGSRVLNFRKQSNVCADIVIERFDQNEPLHFLCLFSPFVYMAKVAFWTWDGSIVSDSLASILSDSKMLKQKEQKSIPEFCKQCVKNGDRVQGSFQYLLF
jgi:hypothetical protein